MPSDDMEGDLAAVKLDDGDVAEQADPDHSTVPEIALTADSPDQTSSVPPPLQVDTHSENSLRRSISQSSSSLHPRAFSPAPSSPPSSPPSGTSSVGASPRLDSHGRFRTVELPIKGVKAGSKSAGNTPISTEPVDEGAPFESVSLDVNGPPRPPLPSSASHGPSPSRSSVLSWKSDKAAKRESFGGFGHRLREPETNGKLNGKLSGAVSSPVSATVSGASTPRRHAPPAHPHPFPIPNEPNSPHPPSTSAPPFKVNPQAHTAALGVKGVSTLDKFISRTRPAHLPPKPKVEDQTHLHQWEHMMAKSREHEAERRKVDEARRLEKERKVVALTPKWENLLNDPDFSVQKVRNNPVLRQLWFEGIPPRLRGQAWSQAIGNPLAMNKDAYRAYLRRAQKALAQHRFPPDILEQIEKDLDDTLPTLHVFTKGSPLRQDLKDLVCAWVVYRSDQARGYAPCVNLVAAMFLLVSTPAVAFLSLVNFLSRPTMSAFYTETQDEIDAFYRVFENLQADMFPRIFANCKNLGLKLPESYFRSVLVEQVPFSVACRLWDQIMLDGDSYIFRAALAIFGFLEPRLYYPDKEEIESVLEGRNRATAAITEREIERAKLKGQEVEEALDGKLSVFGLHEDALFDWLESDGWRESRFDRLVMRELPD